MRDTTIFYRSFFEAIKDLPEQNQLEVYNAIFEYSLNFIEPNLTGLSSTIFRLIKPQIEANNKRFENGKQPKVKRYESKTEAKDKQDKSKTEANNNNNNNVNNNNNKNANKNNKTFTPPQILDVKNYFKENGYSESAGEKAFNYYDVSNWVDSKGNKIKNWKQKMQGVWFKPENKQIQINTKPIDMGGYILMPDGSKRVQ
jgi:hypothetical protein